MKSRQLGRVFALGLGIIFAAVLLGCGSGSLLTTPQASLNPTQHPLVAQYHVDALAPASVWVEFGLDTSYGRQTSPVAAPDGYPNPADVLVAGMKANTTYHMRAHVDYPMADSWIDDDRTFQTGALPANNALSLTVTRPSAAGTPQNGVELLDITAIGTNNLEAVVTDLDGNIIWYYDLGSSDIWPYPIKPLPNGNMLVNRGGQVQADGTESGLFDLQEIDLAGSLVRNLPFDELNSRLQAAGLPQFDGGNVHHDIAILPNGHLILLIHSIKAFTDLPGYPGTTNVVGDALVDLDLDWNPVWTWSTFDHLDINRHLMGLPDWTHANAVIYSPSDGNLIFSMRHQSWLIKIDYADGNGTGNVLWRLGNEGDFAISGGDPSLWFYAQHYPQIVSENGTQLTMSVFDNGNLREDDLGTQCTGFYPDCYSRAVVLQLDEVAKTAAVQWEYLPGFYSFFGGSMGTLENGNVEFAMSAPFGFIARSLIMEVTQTAAPEVVWQMDISGGFAYRGFRMPSLYPGVVWQQ